VNHSPSTEPVTPPTIRCAEFADIPQVVELIEPYIYQRKLLPRTPAELRELVPNGFVAVADKRIVGFAAVEIYSKKLAEVQCMAVAEGYQRQGIGKRLVLSCIQRARENGIRELMAITSSEDFLRDCGFDYSLPDQKKALFVQTRHGADDPPH
jgi:amino-acid N-acetyltransferase